MIRSVSAKDTILWTNTPAARSVALAQQAVNGNRILFLTLQPVPDDISMSIKAKFLNLFLIVHCAGILALTGGCAIHPLPENAAGINTFDIVQKIRCEAYDAVVDSTVALLHRSRDPDVYRLGDQIKNDHTLLSEKIYDQVDFETAKFLRKYDGTAVAFDFTFTMTENNDLTADFGFVSNIFRGSDGLGFNASSTRERQNIRNLRITDTFVTLLTQRPKCNGYTKFPNYIYPITGEVGLFEIFDTFFKLNETVPLRIDLKDKTTLFADTLKFTTAIGGSVDPSVTIVPLGKAFGLSGGMFSASAKRSDIHTLIIAISLPPDEVFVASKGRAQKISVSGAGRAIAKEKVNNLIDYQINKNRPIPLGFGPSGSNLIQ